ncbi:MAG TPA: glycosyltransferase family 39 protein [Terriglobia bacterium]|jgi:predicted membrane-bound mannosyltransferase
MPGGRLQYFLNQIYSNLLFLLIFAVAITLRLLSLRFPFGDFDEGIYTATVRSVAHGFPLISQTFSSQGPLFIYISELFYRVSPSLVALRLFPVLCSLAIIYFAYRLVDQHVGRSAAVFTAAYLAVNTTVLAVSRTFQIDIPWTAFSFASFYFLLQFHHTGKRLQIYVSGLFFGMSLLLKVNPIFIAVLAGYFLLATPIRGWKYSLNIIVFALFPAVILLLAVPANELHRFYVDTVGIRIHTVGPRLQDWTAGLRAGLIKDEWPVILLALLGLAWIRPGKIATTRGLFLILSLVWLLTTVAAFSVYTALFRHHLVFFILPCTLAASIAVQELCKRSTTRLAAVGLFFVLVWIVFRVSLQQNTLQSIISPAADRYDQALQAAASSIDQHSRPGDYVVVDDPIVLYLANRDTPPDLVDTSILRIQNRLLTEDRLEIDTEAFRPVLIVIVSGRLTLLPAYAQFLRTHGYHEETDPQGFIVFSLQAA